MYICRLLCACTEDKGFVVLWERIDKASHVTFIELGVMWGFSTKHQSIVEKYQILMFVCTCTYVCMCACVCVCVHVCVIV